MSDFERIRPSALAPVNPEVPYVVGMTCRNENKDFESVVVYIKKKINNNYCMSWEVPYTTYYAEILV
jgi:hypothetical protein